MAHQMPAPQQTQYPGPIPQQYQSTGQQRHASSAQQSFGQNMPGEAQNTISDTIQGPRLVSFILEKPKNATSWEDVVPEQQHVPVHDLKKEVHKFRRNHNSVTKALNQISSPNCRRIVNELVEEQNVALAKLNPALEYRIVSVVNKFRERVTLTRREVHLVRVDIILEAEDSGFQRTKTGVEMSSNGHEVNSVKQSNSQPHFQGQINNPSQNMAAQHQMPQQRFQHQVPHNPGPQMHSEVPRGQPPVSQGNGHMPMHSQHPPPPAPPSHPNGGMNGQAPMAGPLPPPPQPPTGGNHPTMPGPQMRQPPMQHHSTQGVSRMPGSYPEAIPRPVSGHRSNPLNGPVNPELLRSLKAKYKNHTDTSSLSSDSDISWEDESESSSFVDIQSITHEDASGRENERGRHVKKSTKISRHRVRSRSKRPSRSRSRSQSRPRRVVHERHAQRPERRHRPNSIIDEGYNVRHSPGTSGSNSPQPLHAKLSSQVPANIHIHMNTNHTGEDRTRSGNASPVSISHDKKKSPKPHTSHDSLSEASWDRASGTDSWNTASIHTAEDGTWDVPLRPRKQRQHTDPVHHHHSHHHNHRHPPTPPRRYSHRPSPEPIHSPSYLDHDHHHISTPRPPLPHRRTTTTTSLPSHPPKPTRALSFTPSHSYNPYPPRRHHHQQQHQHRIDSSPRDEQINLRDLHDALEWAREKRKEQEEEEEVVVGMRYGYGVGVGGARRGRRDSGVFGDEEDEWAFEGGRNGRGRRWM